MATDCFWDYDFSREDEVPRKARMRSLPLAVRIADMVSAAKRRQVPLDVEAKAGHLVEAYPEAGASHSEIAETLRDESARVGLI